MVLKPAAFVAGTPRTDPQTPEERADDVRMKEGPGAWFVKTGCFVCHSISSLGVKSPAQIGPDLSTAVEDTRQIVLTPEEKKVAVEKLREAFAEHERQEKDAEKASPGQLIRGYHETETSPKK